MGRTDPVPTPQTFVTVGGLVADIVVPIRHFPVLPQDHQIAHEVTVEPGGLGNCLVMAARLGMRAIALGWVGTDLFGDELCRMLHREGVDVRGVLRQPGRTASSCVLVDDAGRHVFIGGLGVHGPDAPPPAWTDVLGRRAWVMTDGWVLWHNPSCATDALEIARGGGGQVVFDPGPMVHRIPRDHVDRVLRMTDVLLLTEEEAVQLVGPADPDRLAAALRARGPSVVAVKRGAAGAVVLAGDQVIHQPAFPAPVRDTTGAGDAFDAAFVAGLAAGLSVPLAASLAAAAGSLTVSRLGTGTALPTRHDVEAFLTAQGVEVRLPSSPAAGG
jgi:sugar/nucleoside kinase (ribokinase family)